MLSGVGGKAKPLKAPKKEKKELDEDDLAYKAKLKAGMKGKALAICQFFMTRRGSADSCLRCKSKQGNG